MIKKLVKRLMTRGRGSGSSGGRPDIFGRRVEHAVDVHGIELAQVDERAIKIVRTLQNAGYAAYIVGGAVRDLLLGLKPKDFDVATNATPEQVKSLFKHAFIIGRRFRIVHVVFGRGRTREVIEVATFRAYLDHSKAKQVQGDERGSRKALAGVSHAVAANGRVLRDNVWGPQDEDAARRDFSINALYYDPHKQIVVDYHHGVQDARNKRIRMIGDAAERYRQDPVRVIRAVRFAAKLSALGFELDAQTRAPLQQARHLLAQVPPSRLFDEMLKLLLTGHAVASVDKLRQLDMEQGIYPLLDVVVSRSQKPLISAVLRDTDRRVGEGKPVTPAFTLACVLWQDVRAGWQNHLAAGEHVVPALKQAVDEVFEARIGAVSGRGRLGADMREIWMMQPRFERRTGRAPFRLLEQQRFRASFDFLRLRAQTDDAPQELADWWESFSLADEDERDDMVQKIQEASSAASGQRKNRTRQQAPSQPASDADAQEGDAASAAKTQARSGRRRRRRRKPVAPDASDVTGPQAQAD